MNSTTIRYNPDGSIDSIQVDVPDPGPGEVQISGGVCGICAWDVATVKLGSRMQPMAPPGHEGMGYVSAVGPQVTGFREGDRVTGGGFATLRNIPIARVYPIPDSDLPDRFWIVEPVSCVVTGLDHCRLRAGDRIVVIGCGYMGLMLLQGLLHSYAEQVIAIDIVPERLKLAKTLGVQEVHNSATEDVAAIAGMLKSRRIDVVVDTTGSQAGLDLATDIVRPGGVINLFGWIKGETATFDPTKWHLGGFTVINSAPGSRIRDPFPPAIQLIDKGIIDLKPLVTHVVSLQEYPSLMAQVVSGDKTYIKGVVTL